MHTRQFNRFTKSCFLYSCALLFGSISLITAAPVNPIEYVSPVHGFRLRGGRSRAIQSFGVHPVLYVVLGHG